MRNVRHWLLGTAAAVAISVAAAGSAMAATAGTIPGGVKVNDGLIPVYGAGTLSRDGYFGSNWYLVGGPANIKVEFFGSEAGFLNSFLWNGATLVTTPGVAGTGVWGTGPNAPLFMTTVANVASGLLPFSFSSSGGGSVTNGSNPDGSVEPSPINFFASITNNPTATFGQSLDLWLDDNGAGPDDNHDDMMIRISIDQGNFTAAPLPAAVPLMISGLAALGLIGRRRKDETA